jgi:hypothetical protein
VNDEARSFDRAACRTAVKLLQQYQRLTTKLGKRIPTNRLAELERKRDAGTITSDDLPGSLLAEFPGQFAGMTLNEIPLACNFG